MDAKKSNNSLRRLSSYSTIDPQNPFDAASIAPSSKNPFDTASLAPSTAASTSASILSHASSTTITHTSGPFTPTSCLQIQTSGHSMVSLPIPPKTLETPIFTVGATGRCEVPVYISIRPLRTKGHCDLVRADDETRTPIATTRYRLGPSADPVVEILDDATGRSEFTMETRWTSRTLAFGFGGQRFEWRYGGRKERKRVAEARGEGCDNLLILERVMGDERRQVARLVRGEETRTPGTKKSNAGNGGRLELSLEGEWSSGDGVDKGGSGISEAVVVVTVLVMLKKEIDRMRGWQAVVIAGVLGP
ncbi:hypothetical protein V501_07914 [Pseudogymnoascus sp. VKM F-4519 (FW-2642)]|nr:hypothetical protein V501_07914 [Pseudogymnoascus sp. VKM F-4519 (FW-2642)]